MKKRPAALACFFLLTIFISSSLIAAPLPQAVVDQVVADALAQTSRTKGMCLDLAAGTGQIGTKIANDTGFFVHGFEVTDADLGEARKTAVAAGIYTTDISIEKGGMATLPYPDNFIDLIIRGDLYLDGVKDIDYNEIHRVLVPGGAAYIGQSDGVTGAFTLTSAALQTALDTAGITTYTIITANGVWAKITKDKPAGMDGWSHDIFPNGRGSMKIRANAANTGAGNDDTLYGPFTMAYACGPKSPGGKGAVQTISDGYYIQRWGGVQVRSAAEKIQVFSSFNGMFLYEFTTENIGGHGLINKDDYMFIVSGDKLTAYNVHTGTKLWDKAAGAAVTGMTKWTIFCYEGGVLVAGLDDDAASVVMQHVRAYDPDDGTELWAFDPPSVAGAMCMGGGRVFISCDGDSLRALNALTGNQDWTKPGISNNRLRYYAPQDWIMCDNDMYAAADGAAGLTNINTGIIGGDRHVSGGLGSRNLSDGGRYKYARVSGREVETQTDLGLFEGYHDPYHPKMETFKQFDSGLSYVRCYPFTGSKHCVQSGGKGLVIGNVNYLTDNSQDPFFYYEGLARPDCDTNAIFGSGRVLCPPTGCGCDLVIKTAVGLAPMPAAQHKAAVNESIQLENGPAIGDTITFSADTTAWRAFRHDSGHSGRTNDDVTASMAVNWETALAGNLTPPAAADGRIFVGSDNHRIYGLDAGTGLVLWEYITGGAVYTTPVYWEGRVYAGSVDGHVYCLRADTGALIWRFRGAPNKRYFNFYTRPFSCWPVTTGVVVDGGVVNFIAGFATGDRIFTYALDATDGTIIWSNDAAGHSVDFGPTGILDGKTVAKQGAAPYGLMANGVMAANATTIFAPRGLRPPLGIDRSDGSIKWHGIRGTSEQRSNFHLQWKNGSARSGGFTVVLGDDTYLFAGGYNWMMMQNFYFFCYRQDNGKQLHQDSPELFWNGPTEWRDTTPGPTFGDQLVNNWGPGAHRFGGYTNAPVLDPAGGGADGLLYKTTSTGIYDFKSLKDAQIGTAAANKVANLIDGAVVVAGTHHIVGRQASQEYRIYTKGTATQEQSVTSSAASGNCITDGMAVNNGNLLAATGNSYIVCFSNFVTGGTSSVSGTITGDLDPAMRLGIDGPSRASVTMGGGGTFTIGNLVDGTYTVTPVMPGYTFAPASRTFSISGGNITGIDFTAAQNTAAGNLQLSAATYMVGESDGTAAIAVTRSGGSDGLVSAEFSTIAGGSAAAGTDYTGITAQSVSFADGDSAPKTVTITVLPDTDVEGDETVNLEIANIAGGATLGLAAAVLTIADDDLPGEIAFSSAAFLVDENIGTGQAVITITRTGGSAGLVTADFSTIAGGSATVVSDYAAVTNLQVSFPDGDTAARTVTVDIADDVLQEGNETVNLALTNAGGGATLGTASAALTIVDNDQPGQLAFSMSAYTIAEDGATVDIIVTRAGGDTGIVTVEFSTVAGGTAVDGTDYTGISSQLVSFGDGVTTPQTVTITVLDDGSPESDETVNLSLANPGGGAVLGAQSTAVLTIMDNDSHGILQFSSASFSVAEDILSGQADIIITRTGGSDGAVSVEFSTVAGGTASDGVDYGGITAQVVSFADGITTPQMISLAIVDDLDTEGDETINLQVANVTGGAILGPVSSGILTILDDEVTGPAASGGTKGGCAVGSGCGSLFLAAAAAFLMASRRQRR